MDVEKIAEIIKKARKDAGLTQKQVADKLGITYQAISNYERGKNRIEISVLTELCSIYGLSVTKVLQDEDLSSASTVEPLGEYHPTHRIPILGRVAAGVPMYAEENIEGYTYSELNGGAEYFALRVKGDSMTAARIADGDLIICRAQDIVENGQIAVVLVNDQEATVKIYRREGDLVTLLPQSYNPAHKPQIYDLRKTRIKILGLVVEVKFRLN